MLLLLNYFGIAIRQNTDNLIDMEKSVGAVVYHCNQASDSDARHWFCTKSAITWCKYQAAKQGYYICFVFDDDLS